MQGAPAMKKLIVFILFLLTVFFSENLFAIPHSFFINAFTGFSVAERQNGFICDDIECVDKIEEHNFLTRNTFMIGVGYAF